MKTIMMMAAAAAAVMLTGCYSAPSAMDDVIGVEPELGEGSGKAKVFTFHVKGDFVTCYDEMETRAGGVRLEEDNTAGITDVWVLDYVDGVLVQQVHQTSADADFGHPQMSLAYGTHAVKLVAAKGEGAVLTAVTGTEATAAAPHSLSWTRVKDSFALDYPVTVSASTNGNRAPELARCVSGVSLVMTDAIPADVTAVDITMTEHYDGLTLPELSVGEAAAETVRFAMADTDAGRKLTLNMYSMAPTEAWTTSVTVTAWKGTEQVSTLTVDDVELRRNRMTTLTGEVFGRGSGFSIAVLTPWDDPLDMVF